MTEVSLAQDAAPFPVRLVVATSVCVMGLPLAALAGMLGAMNVNTGDAPSQGALFLLSAFWPISCILGPLGAWGAYVLGYRKFSWLFLVWPLALDLFGGIAFLWAMLPASA